MDTFNEVIMTFLNEKGYLKNKGIEGIVFYGSASTGYTTDCSDIDLQIITNDEESTELIRGVEIVNGFRIEYFEKPLSDYYRRAVRDFQNQSNVLLSMIGHGIVIFDRNGKIKKLQEYINIYYSIPLPGLSTDEAQEMVSIINNRMIDLRFLYTHGDLYFHQLYALTLEKIKKFYHRLNGFPEISTSKTLKIYTDTTGYRERIFKTIPEQEFIDLYIDALDLHQQKSMDEKMNSIETLYNYAKRNVELNEYCYRIKIKPRN